MAAISVSIYIDQQCWAGSVLLIQELLSIAGPLNARQADLRASAMFEVALVGPTLRAVRSMTGAALSPDFSLRTAPPAQVLVLPSFYGDVPAAPALLRWLREAYRDGACILAIASGVQLLARTGLLDGRDATCNLAERRHLATRHPHIRLSPQLPLLVDGRLITAASITPAVEACAHLVNRFHGEKAALKFARYTNSARQLSYEQAAINAGSRHAHDDARIVAAQRYIEQHCCAGISPDDVARHAAMSARNLARRFRAAAGMAPVQYILHCRIEQAKRLLAKPGWSMRRVALDCGFADEASFRRAFRRLAGQAPRAWKNLLGT